MVRFCSSDLYQSVMPPGSLESMHNPVRSNSASSLLDGGPHFGGFPSCPSPNMLPSRTMAARFTPPGLLNGVGTNNSIVSQANFMMPPDMIVCGNSQTQIPGTTMCSPPQPPASYTPEAMETSNMMHSSMSQTQSITSVKSSNSPLMFGCYGSNANGTSMPPDCESSLRSVCYVEHCSIMFDSYHVCAMDCSYLLNVDLLE